MLAVDTNVLVRFLTRDDRVQSPKARDVLRDNDVWAPITVVLETEWVLRAVYGFSASQFADAMIAIAGLPRLQIQHSSEVDRALALHRTGMDFADVLHLMLATGCSEMVTFDRPFARAAAREGLPVRAL
jgi:predicted nucleic-acid-binding protein